MTSLDDESIDSESCISMFLIHRFAYPCGSVISGHFIPVYIMIAFSMENESTGRPDICHLRIKTCSPSTVSSEKLSEVCNLKACI